MTNEINNSTEIVDDFSTVFHTIFKDRGELIKYRMKFMDINSIEIFNGILRLIRLHYKFNKIDVDKNDDLRVLLDMNKLLFMTTIVEVLLSKEKHISFDKWLNKVLSKENTKCQKLWQDYIEIHGASKKFRTFFLEFLNKDEQIKLMKNIQLFQKDEKGEIEVIPLCSYNSEDCNLSQFKCNYDINQMNCPAYDNNKYMKKPLKECADFLYYIRSKFVHEAQLYLFPEPLQKGFGGTSSSFNYIDYRFRNRGQYNGLIKMDLFPSIFIHLVKIKLKKLMDTFIETKK